MSGKDPLPRKDADFDTLQQGIIKAVTENASAWKIPAREIATLQQAQAEWNSTWAIARNRYNSSTSQRTAKDLARKELSRLLRPFIQRWIHRNPKMDRDAVMLCGLKPRTEGRNGVFPPVPDGIKISNGETGEMFAICNRMAGVESYGCIVSEGAPLPSWFRINTSGQVVIKGGSYVTCIIDNTKGRKKKFTGLKSGATYYFYFYAINARGVSVLSEPVAKRCW